MKNLKQRPPHDPIACNRHEKFQFGKNPMQESDFEKKLVLQEKIDRKKVKLKQIWGMQGCDGGRCWDRVIDDNLESC